MCRPSSQVSAGLVVRLVVIAAGLGLAGLGVVAAALFIAAWFPVIVAVCGFAALVGVVCVVRELRAAGPMWRPVYRQEPAPVRRRAVEARPSRAIERPRRVLPGMVIEHQDQRAGGA